MPITKEVLSFFSGNEPAIDLLFKILLSNNSYTDKLQKISEEVAKQAEVASDE